MKHPKLTGIHTVQNSSCINLEIYVPDPNLEDLIFGRKPNEIRPPAHGDTYHDNQHSRMVLIGIITARLESDPQF